MLRMQKRMRNGQTVSRSACMPAQFMKRIQACCFVVLLLCRHCAMTTAQVCSSLRMVFAANAFLQS